MKQFYALFLFLGVSCLTTKAQAPLTPLGYFYRTQWQLVNPAAIDRILTSYHGGAHPDLHFVCNVRPQWQLTGLEGAPLTGYLSFENAPKGNYFLNKHPIRWGVSFFGDKTDFLRHYGLYGNYSYEIKFSNLHQPGHRSKLRFGLSGGALHRFYGTPRPRDPTDSLLVRPPTHVRFDMAFGVFYQKFLGRGNTTYWGASLPNAFSSNISSNRDSFSIIEKLGQFYFLWGRYFASHARLGENRGLEWEPNIWVRGVPRTHLRYYTLFRNGALPISIEATLRMYMQTEYDKPARFWLGAGIGTNRMLTLESGFNQTIEKERNLQVGISFGRQVGRNVFQLGNTFEITIALTSSKKT